MAIDTPTQSQLFDLRYNIDRFVRSRAPYEDYVNLSAAQGSLRSEVLIPHEDGEARPLHLRGTPPPNVRLLIGPGWTWENLLNLEHSEGNVYVGQSGYDVFFSSGLLFDPEHGRYFVYRADAANRIQHIWTSHRGSFEFVLRAITPANLESVAWKDVPRDIRFRYMRSLAMHLNGRGHHHVGIVESIVRPSQPNGIAPRFGAFLSWGDYYHARGITKEFGKAVANAEELSSYDAIELLEQLPHSVDPEPMLDAWNERCYPGDELFHADCGHYDTVQPTSTYCDGTVCTSCLEDDYVWAEDVEDYIQRSEAYLSYGSYYYHDQDVDEDDDECLDYVLNYGDNVLHYAPADLSITPSAYGEFLMGIELEVVPGSHTAATAARNTSEDFESYAILKRDGSLPDRGFEIVTAPRGLKEHIERFKEWTPHPDLRAWDSGCCGMHVHISSQAFTQATLGKFIEFINSPENDAFIEAIAGRHPQTDSQSQAYCQREGAISLGNPKKTLEGKSTHRYRMVNTQNLTYSECSRLGLSSEHASGRGFNTVELRIFRATLKKERLLAQIEFAHAAVMFCRWASFRALTGREFLEWLQGMAGQYPHLARWFGVRANTKHIEAQPKARETADV